MSFKELKDIAETPSAQAANTTNNARNVPLRVGSYDLEKNSVTGIDLFTGEEMTITLRPDPQADTREFKRADIKEFAGKGKAGKREKVYTEEGGVLMFDLVYPDPKADGKLTAKWARPYSHDENEAEVFVSPAAPYTSPAGKFSMDVLRTIAAAPVSTVEELKDAVVGAMHNSFSGAVIRVSDGQDTTLFTQGRQDRIGRSKKVGAKYETVPAEEAFEDFLQTPFGKHLAKTIGQDYVTEVIPVERIYAGKDTQASLKSQENFEAFHKMGAGVGFTDTVIAIRRHEEGGAFLCARPIPVQLRANLYQMKDVPTANISPKVQPFVNGSDAVSDINLEEAGVPSVDDVANKLASASRAMGKPA
jgi:hypothetical protein